MMPDATRAYARAREREGRILPDELVRELPRSGARTAQADEWLVRQRSLKRTLALFAGAGRPLHVLEVGCGNGWFSACLAEAGHRVTAIDTHASEVEQARRVFGDGKVAWSVGDPFSLSPPATPFDRVLLAASLQYFPDPRALIHHLFTLLAPDGEVHVVDTVLYPDPATALAATGRSQNYYARLGVPEMSAHYHHHLMADVLAAGEARVVRSPGRFVRWAIPPRLVNDPFHHTVHRSPYS